MAFTTQALASVAYQVGNLAGHTLRMLDLQAAALRQVEARVSTVGQVSSVGKPLASASNSLPHLNTFSIKTSLSCQPPNAWLLHRCLALSQHWSTLFSVAVSQC